MIQIIVIVVILGFLGFIGYLVWWSETHACPREIRGYNCHNGNPNYPQGCDHSQAAIDEANWDMHRR